MAPHYLFNIKEALSLWHLEVVSLWHVLEAVSLWHIKAVSGTLKYKYYNWVSLSWIDDTFK